MGHSSVHPPPIICRIYAKDQTWVLYLHQIPPKMGNLQNPATFQAETWSFGKTAKQDSFATWLRPAVKSLGKVRCHPHARRAHRQLIISVSLVWMEQVSMILLAGGQEMATIFYETEDKKDNMVSFCYWLKPNSKQKWVNNTKL